jgi:prepilin-type N-terminal cleavage/methylation domain-containing protein
MRLNRSGFSLVELLAALVISGVLAAATFRLLDRSQRHARGIAQAADERAQLAVAAFATEGELQGVSPGDGDLLAGSDSAIAYLGDVGSGVACALTPTSVLLPPSILSSGAMLTWWNTSPQAGDSLMIYDEGTTLATSDDRWSRSAVAAVAPLVNACIHTAFLDSIADLGAIGWRITTTTPLSPTIPLGAVVRVARPQRFALYRSGAEWMLGWTEWNSALAGWNTIQPVAGPLLPFAGAPATSGVRLRWLDSLQAPVSPLPSSHASTLALSLGATTRLQVRMDGVSRGARRDSVGRRVALRNAR